ncbi:MAG: dienelactone hydrolase family protein, partial [bacterium]
MQETIRDIQTRSGAMESFIVHPDRGGPHPAVLMLMDAPGIREELYDMARRLASCGFYVVLPNLYYRAGRDSKFGPGVLTMGDPERDRMRAIRTHMTTPPVMEDVADMLGFLDTQRAAKPGPVGTHGYCMSGPYALAAAARFPGRIRAAASFYGTWLVSDAAESPHRSLGQGLA